MALATIVKVESIKAIEKANTIELASVLGWDVVVRKAEFKLGDLVIFFRIGSILDDKQNADAKFLRGKPLKTKRILDVISQGLLAPLRWATYYGADEKSLKEGDDVTELMKVTKFVPEDEKELTDGSNFPSFVPKTQEERIQNVPKRLRELVGRRVVITKKYDGTSTTFIFKNGVFLICSRNRVETASYYGEMAKKYDIECKMKAYGADIAIQGETCGPKIGGNRLQLKERDFFVFNVFDIKSQQYLPYQEMMQITQAMKLKTVDLVYEGELKAECATVPHLLQVAGQQRYTSGAMAEGIVIKSDLGPEFPRASFKAISAEYQIRHNL